MERTDTQRAELCARVPEACRVGSVPPPPPRYLGLPHTRSLTVERDAPQLLGRPVHYKASWWAGAARAAKTPLSSSIRRDWFLVGRGRHQKGRGRRGW